jgi:hypothetical protein
MMAKVSTDARGRSSSVTVLANGALKSAVHLNVKSGAPYLFESESVGAKFSYEWMLAVILPDFERRLHKREQLQNEDEFAISSEQNDRLKKWFLDLIDRARVGHRIQHIKVLAIVSLVVVAVAASACLYRIVAALDVEQSVSLLGSAGGERAKQWFPDVRARAILYSASSIEKAYDDRSFLVAAIDKMAEASVWFTENVEIVFRAWRTEDWAGSSIWRGKGSRQAYAFR